MVELKIMRPDDSGEYYTTEVHGRLNSYSFNTVHPLLEENMNLQLPQSKIG